jgi:hypothetical protein
MAMLKVTTWQPDTHLGCVVEFEWEYDMEARRNTGRKHRAVSVRYPDGTYIHRDMHEADVVQEHYRRLLAEHLGKNHAYNIIIESLLAHMKKPMFDSDGDPVLDDAGKPTLAVKDKHRPRFKHTGSGRYEFVVPGIDEATHCDLAAKLRAQFGDKVVLLKPGSKDTQ